MCRTRPDTTDHVLPCTWQPRSVCAGCPTDDRLMCRFHKADLVSFFMVIFPFGVTSVAGMIRAGLGRYLWFWIAYMGFFFFVWEARVLCRHCPFWAEPSEALHCHANYGVFKLWPYDPRPMTRAEGIQFIIGALLFVAFPFPFLLVGGEYLLAAIALSAAISGTYGLKRHICSRCVHFSCPLNGVPKPLVDAYLSRNLAIREAWEASGYRLDET